MSLILKCLDKAGRCLTVEEIIEELSRHQAFRNLSAEEIRERVYSMIEDLAYDKCIRRSDEAYTITCRGKLELRYRKII